MIYIYTLKDPFTDEIRYVGKTFDLQQRFRQHVCITEGPKVHSKAWVTSIIRRGSLPIMEVLEKYSKDDQDWLEIYWISQFRTWGFNLTNLTFCVYEYVKFNLTKL